MGRIPKYKTPTIRKSFLLPTDEKGKADTKVVNEIRDALRKYEIKATVTIKMVDMSSFDGKNLANATIQNEKIKIDYPCGCQKDGTLFRRNKACKIKPNQHLLNQ